MATIQEMVDALPAGGGRIVLAAGTYTLNAKVSVTKSNVTILGTGDDTIVRVADGVAEADYGAFYLASCSNFRLAHLQIDGNRAGQSGYAETPGLVSPSNVNGIKVENCHIHHSMGDSIEPYSCQNVRLVQNWIHDGKQHAIHLNGVANGYVVGNWLFDDDSSLLTMWHGGVNGVVVAYNAFVGKLNLGGYIITAAGNDAPPGMRQNVKIIHNLIDLNGGLGILIADNSDQVQITGNTFRRAKVSGYHIYVGTGITNLRIAPNWCDEAIRIQYL